jgi:hypothetical protein
MSFLTRTWNNTPISRRATDGYVNATAMAKANGKEWHNYFQTDRATTYLEALSRNLEIQVTSLYFAKPGEGTWIHPRVAVDFARWISPEFAVWMDGWFMESFQQPITPALTAVENAERTVALLRDVALFFEEIGGMDDRDRLMFRDLGRNQLLKLTGGSMPQLTGGTDELTLSDAWLEVFGEAMPRGKGPAVGRIVAEMYREQFKEEPPTRTQYVDGAPRKVKSYVRNWLLSALESIKQYR